MKNLIIALNVALISTLSILFFYAFLDRDAMGCTSSIIMIALCVSWIIKTQNEDE